MCGEGVSAHILSMYFMSLEIKVEIAPSFILFSIAILFSQTDNDNDDTICGNDSDDNDDNENDSTADNDYYTMTTWQWR